MLKAGFDLGSRYVKVAISDNEAISFDIYDTISFYKKYVSYSDNKAHVDTSFIQKDRLKGDKLSLTATGYGRNLLDFDNVSVISEIKAHFRGVLEQVEDNTFVLLDIGGQDSKVIYVNDRYIEDFVMNDKCAASTGRFFENAARILEMDIFELFASYEEPVEVSSTCAVFGESEIIGYISRGVPIEQIAAGINMSIAKRIAPLIRSFKSERVYATGGVANNNALLYFLSKQLGIKITPVNNPQYTGCIGCLHY